MIEIFTTSVDDNFSSVWGPIVENTRCKVHTINVPLSDNYFVDENGEYMMYDSEWNIVPVDFSGAEDLILSQDEKYDYSQSDYIQSLLVNGADVTKYPNAIFLLDIPEEKAMDISKRFGVICQATCRMSADILKHKFEREIKKNDPIYSCWSDCLSAREGDSLGNVIPSSSLIILDRYLFTGDGPKDPATDNASIDAEIKIGMDNVLQLIKCIVPDSFGDTYHVLLLFDPYSMVKDVVRNKNNKAAMEAYCDNIAKSLHQSVKELYKRTKIVTEILCIDPTWDKEDFYSETHDRRLLCNYFILRPTKNLKAFRDNCVQNSQTVYFDMIFSKGLDGTTLFDSDPPYKSHQHIISVIKTHISYCVNNNVLIDRCYQNGSLVDIAKICNSIIS